MPPRTSAGADGVPNYRPSGREDWGGHGMSPGEAVQHGGMKATEATADEDDDVFRSGYQMHSTTPGYPSRAFESCPTRRREPLNGQTGVLPEELLDILDVR